MAETTQTEEKKGKSIWGTLKKIGSRALLIASGLLTPVGLKFYRNEQGKRRLRFDFNHIRGGIFFGLYMIVQPLSVFLFPTLSTTLKKQGIDPETTKNVTEVSADNIRVVPDNLGGKLYTLFATPPILNPIGAYQNVQMVFNDDVRAFETEQVGIIPGLISPKMQRIYLKSDTETRMDAAEKETKDIIENASGGLFTYDDGLTGAQFQLAVLLHETRHSSNENKKLSPAEREADADYYGMTEAARLTNDANLPQNFIDFRALNHGGGNDKYNDALYLYLRFNNASMPSAQDLQNANLEATPALNAASDYCIGSVVGDKKVDSLKSAFDKAVAPLSPLAKLRVQLYLDAFQRHNPVNMALFDKLLTPGS